MARRQSNVPNVVNVLIGGALWFISFGVMGAIGAVSGDPAYLGASLGVMAFGILGGGVLLATLRSLKDADDTRLPLEKSDTSRIKIQRRGASKAA